MDKAFDLIMCAVFSMVLGSSWGGVLYLYDPVLGLSIGVSLFLLCMLVLVNSLGQYEEPDRQQNRRFNDA